MARDPASLSDLHGASEGPLVWDTAGHLLAMTIARLPDIEALAAPYRCIQWTHSEFDREVTEVAAGFADFGPSSLRTGINAQASVDDPIARRAETVGCLLPPFEIKIVDDAGCIVPRGTPGELKIPDYWLLQRFRNDPEESAEAIGEAPWNGSDDVSVVDDEGHFRIAMRSSYMLIRSGENFFPREIEDILCTQPAIEHVEVTGGPDEKSGEEIRAVIRLRRIEAEDA